jgi:hypothetical protein
MQGQGQFAGVALQALQFGSCAAKEVGARPVCRAAVTFARGEQQSSKNNAGLGRPTDIPAPLSKSARNLTPTRPMTARMGLNVARFVNCKSELARFQLVCIRFNVSVSIVVPLYPPARGCSSWLYRKLSRRSFPIIALLAL